MIKLPNIPAAFKLVGVIQNLIPHASKAVGYGTEKLIALRETLDTIQDEIEAYIQYLDELIHDASKLGAALQGLVKK